MNDIFKKCPDLAKAVPVLVNSETGEHDVDYNSTLVFYKDPDTFAQAAQGMHKPWQNSKYEMLAHIDVARLVDMLSFIMETDQLEVFKDWLNKSEKNEDPKNQLTTEDILVLNDSEDHVDDIVPIDDDFTTLLDGASDEQEKEFLKQLDSVVKSMLGTKGCKSSCDSESCERKCKK